MIGLLLAFSFALFLIAVVFDIERDKLGYTFVAFVIFLFFFVYTIVVHPL